MCYPCTASSHPGELTVCSLIDDAILTTHYVSPYRLDFILLTQVTDCTLRSSREQKKPASEMEENENS